MSFQDVDAVLNSFLPEVPGFDAGTLKLVLVCIAQHTNAKKGDNSCFPSRDRLSEMTGYAPSVISRAVDTLNQIGAFKTYIRGGGRTHSTYVLDMDAIKNDHYRVTTNLDEISSESVVPKTPEIIQKTPEVIQKTPEVIQEEGRGLLGGFRTPSKSQSYSEKPHVLVAEPGSLTGNLTSNVSRNESSKRPSVATTTIHTLQNQKEEKQEKPGNPSGVLGLKAEKGKDKTNPDPAPLTPEEKKAKYPGCTCYNYLHRDRHAGSCALTPRAKAAVASTLFDVEEAE